MKLYDLFLHPLRGVRISKKIPSLTLQLTQLDAESIIDNLPLWADYRFSLPRQESAAFRDSILDDGRGMRPITMIIEKTCRSVTRPLVAKYGRKPISQPQKNRIFQTCIGMCKGLLFQKEPPFYLKNVLKLRP